MNRLNHFLADLFYQPQHPIFLGLKLLHHHLAKVLISTFSLIIAYPAFQYADQWQSTQMLNQKLIGLNKENEQQKALLASLSHFQSQQQQSTNVGHIHRQLKEMIKQEGAQLVQLQWLLGEHKRLSLITSSQTAPILSLLERLSYQPNLQFQYLTLQKQPNRQLELNAIVAISQQEMK